ncbi:SDR family NAD(P)-dependent oxidoreductase [Rhodospirillum centenum]|uniref:NADP-dependent L-serine n=1 Tax=Rhodospirillum centenum (strain ATCC 51521 / SW) TaxID=414684 RepID=B6IQ52_RHOCS|nr:SDR family NAD(P)-dependent oxidoreductase [Rhodospirillum centenum]ACI97588.1 NADP-dependent L-serine [Rhodospirillum centenum SW]
MSQSYRPETVLITGATGGFGTAFAHRFAGLGCRLVLVGRDAAKLRALASGLTVPVHTVQVDVRDRPAVEAALAALPTDFAAIDLLINNAGLALGADPAFRSNLDDWEVMIDTNDKALAVMTGLVLPGMVARGRGHIINISSTAGSYPYPGGHVYCASKAFVTQFSLALRADLIGTGVRVTSIEPGMVETDFSLVRFKGDAEKAARVYADTTPLTADDVAEAVVWAGTLPPHFNINRIELMPTTQGPGALGVHRSPKG